MNDLRNSWRDYSQFLSQNAYQYSFVGLGSLLVALHLQHQFKKDESFYKNIKHKTIFTIESLKDSIEQAKPEIAHQASPVPDHPLIRDFGNPNHMVMFESFIEGIIEQNDRCQGIESSIMRQKSFITKINLLRKERIDSNHQYFINNKLFDNINVFDLKDLKSNQKILVHNDPTVDKSFALQGIQKIYPFKVSALKEWIVKLASLFSKQCSIGYSDSEIGIQMQSYLLIYGQLIYNFETRELMVWKPLFYLKEKSQIIESLKQELNEQKNLIYIIMTTSIISLSIFAYKFIKFYQNKDKKTIKFGRLKIKI